MHRFRFVSALIVSSQILLACSSDSSSDPPIDDEGSSPDLVDPSPGPIAGACLPPPDFDTGDELTYRYTDTTDATMDISLSITSSDSTSIVFDVTEGASVYQAAVSTYCNDTPEIDIPGGDVPDSLQALFDQYLSRPLLQQIIEPDIFRFDDAVTVPGTAEGVTGETCERGSDTAPISGDREIETNDCTVVYDPDMAGGTLEVRSSIALSRRGLDYDWLLEKVQTFADGSRQSLTLVSFDEAPG